MELTKEMTELICELEYIVGKECYNPSSYNGYTMEEGCTFRYPVCYLKNNNTKCKTRGIIKDLAKDSLDSICYKFGSNELYIGGALYKVLQQLENKYGLDFEKLAKQKSK